MGWDKHYGYQLYQSDPSGNYSGWKATCIGNNSAVSFIFLDWFNYVIMLLPLCNILPHTTRLHQAMYGIEQMACLNLRVCLL